MFTVNVNFFLSSHYHKHSMKRKHVAKDFLMNQFHMNCYEMLEVQILGAL